MTTTGWPKAIVFALILPLIILLIYPSIVFYRATRLENNDTWRALCVRQTERAHLQFIPDSLKSYSYFSNSSFLVDSGNVGGFYNHIFLCVSRHFPVYVRHTFITSLFPYFPALR